MLAAQTVFNLSLVSDAGTVVRAANRQVDESGDLLALLPAALNELLADETPTAGAAKYRRPDAEQLSLAVFDLRALGVPVDLAKSLTQILAAELRQVDHTQVISRTDIVAMLELEAQKRRLDCADDLQCLAEIGGALGVQKLVVGDVGRLGERSLVALRLIDVRGAVVDQRITEAFLGADDLFSSAVRLAGRRLLGVEAGDPGRLTIAGSEPGADVYLDEQLVGTLPLPPVEELAAGRHTLRVQREGFLDWRSDVYIEPGTGNAAWAALSERPAPWYRRWWVWAIAGGVVAGITIGLVVGLQPQRASLTVEGAVPGMLP